MRPNFKKIFFSFLFFLIAFPSLVWAITLEECEQKLEKGELSLDQAHECEGLLDELYLKAGEQRRTLQGEIGKFNTTIALTTTKIYQTVSQIKTLEAEIKSLLGKIGQLDLSLDQISQILLKRIAETYKKGKIEPVTLLFSSQDFADFVSRFKYLQIIQHHDRQLMIQLENVRTNYEDQKNLKEQRQQELEAAKQKLETQKNLLDQQKADKENLLKLTQNNELRYQELLASTRAEIEAIQGIVAGKGEETEAGQVGEGSRIATIITGASACSTGTHLHFEVREGGSVKNPFSYLRNISLVDQSGGDPYAATGSWNWPLNEPIKFNQGYGANTAAIRARIVWYDFHTGIDIVSDDRAVKASKSGTLYRGSIGCGGGTLRYVRVDHQDSGIDTFYVHVNY